MRNENRQIITNGVMTARVTSLPQPLDNLVDISIQALWVGTTPVGTLTVQVSNVPIPASDADWSALAAPAPIALSGNAGNGQFNIPDAGFKWVRLDFTFTSGTGTLQAWFNGKGG